MLPAFVIGLREGLETVVILGAIAVFLAHQRRRDQLRLVWIAAGGAAALCVVVAILLHVIELDLSVLAEERFESVIGAAAVLTVTYMVVWMRRFPKDLMAESSATAARQLARGSARALVAMAFFAVLREGFEVSVFVLALSGAGGNEAVDGLLGAVFGVLVAVAIGFAIIRGGVHFDVARFFRITAVVLILSAAGLAMTAVHEANAAGWVLIGQSPQFDWSAIVPAGGIASSIMTGMFGIQPFPVLIEVIVWLGYLLPMLLVVLLPRRLRAVSSSASLAGTSSAAAQRRVP